MTGNGRRRRSADGVTRPLVTAIALVASLGLAGAMQGGPATAAVHAAPGPAERPAASTAPRAAPGPAERPAASTAGHAAPHLTAAPASVADRTGPRSPEDSGQQCFYTFPDCTSSDPDATFGLASAGDSTGCGFHGDVDWGDGTTTSEDFPGGPDQSLLVTFDHTYAQQGTYSIAWSVTVTSGTSCVGSSDTFQFTYATVAAAAVRFAPLTATTPGTPGLPVIKDDLLSNGQADPVLDHEFGPANCAGLDSPEDYDWLNCSASGTGSLSKNWPVIYPAGGTVTIDEAVFISPTDLTGAQLSATAEVGGQTLTLAATPLTSTQAGDDYQLTAGNLAFSGTLPATPGAFDLDITWSVTLGDATIPAGESIGSAYVTAATYAQPNSKSTAPVPPYITLLDVGTEAASGQSGPKAVYDAIWQAFTTRDIAHPILDPQTGEVSHGPDLGYYHDGWDTIGDLWNMPIGDCPSIAQFLATDSGHCQDFGLMLADVLAYQGISVSPLPLGHLPGFYTGPDPAPGDDAQSYAFMLVDPKLWHFGTKSGSGRYAYVDHVTVKNGRAVVSGKGLSYHPSGTPISQGLVSTPPPAFTTGDHMIVGSEIGFVDPSYGNPQDSDGYQTIDDYAKAAIAGYAVLYYAVTHGKKTAWVPAVNTTRVRKFCAAGRHRCQFRAVPYGQSGAP